MLDAESRYPIRVPPASQLASEPGPAADASADRPSSPAATGGELAERMAAALTDREPGWRLPRRSALAKRYGTDIGEIDAAIADLVRRSLIRRLPDGQLYRASPAEDWIGVEGIDELGTRLDPMGNTIGCLSRQVSRGKAPRDVAIALGQPPEAHLRMVRCVWTADDEPVAVSVAYVPDQEAGQEGTPVAPLRAAAVSVQLSPPHPETARALRVPASLPVITVTVGFGGAAGGRSAVSTVTLKPELFRVAIDLPPAGTEASLARPAQTSGARPSYGRAPQRFPVVQTVTSIFVT